MQIQSLTMRSELEPYMAKSEVVHNVNGHEFDPEMIRCRICHEYARSLSEYDTSPVLGVSIKEGKYMLYQKLHAIQQQQNIANGTGNQSHEQNNSHTIEPKQSSDENLANTSTAKTSPPPKSKTTILTLPTEIRLMIYASLFDSLTQNTLSRATSYPLPPLLRAHSVFRNESLSEWGSHLERAVAAHKRVQQRNHGERKLLVQRARDYLVSRSGNTIKLEAMLAANAGQSKVVVKRVDKLRLLQAHQMLAESGPVLGAGGSGDRWRNGRV